MKKRDDKNENEVEKVTKNKIELYKVICFVCVMIITAVAILKARECGESNGKTSDGGTETTGIELDKNDSSDVTEEQNRNTDTNTDLSTEEHIANDTEKETEEDTAQQGNYMKISSKEGTYFKYPDTTQIRVDNAAYDISGYSDEVSGMYAELVNKVAEKLGSETNIYSLLIPTSYSITLPDDIKNQIPSYVEQSEHIDKVFNKYSSKVIQINCYNNLMKHRDEYLYFRTDHHWNGRGAYYAYESFCKVKGVKPYKLKERTEIDFDGFLGSFYSGNREDKKLLPADTVNAYYPHSTSTTIVFYNEDDVPTEWSIIKDVSTWNSASKYSTFAGGDNPLTKYTNPEVKDDSVCIIINESYGNALIPFLIDHYSTIYEIDFRYWNGNVIEFANEIHANDVIFANSIVMVSTGSLVGKISNIIN